MAAAVHAGRKDPGGFHRPRGRHVRPRRRDGVAARAVRRHGAGARMMTLRLALLVIVGLLAAAPAGAQRPRLSETPSLAPLVDAGKLPRVQDRVPQDAPVTEFSTPGSMIGKHGGDLRLLMGRPQDVRMMVVYGYARLVGYNSNFDIVPDLLRAVDVDRDRVFTFHLRRGHRWSDGQPFTAEDFRYWRDDVINNKDLSPFGVPNVMLVDGKPLPFEVLDALTVRYSWDEPNPYFLPALAGPSPLSVFRAAHYLIRSTYHSPYPTHLPLSLPPTYAR